MHKNKEIYGIVLDDNTNDFFFEKYKFNLDENIYFL